MKRKNKIHDVDFLILVRIDSLNRLENTLMVTEHLFSCFDADIHVWEYGSSNNHILERLLPGEVKYTFHEDYDVIFHRTKFLNQMVKHTKKPYAAIWDADVLVPCMQIEQAVDALYQGADLVYPYNSRFYDVSYELRNIYMETRDLKMLESNTSFMNVLFGRHPVGGAFLVNVNTYETIGTENESFYGWGLEDGERYKRFESQGKSIVRINGNIYHLSHPRIESGCIRSHLEDVAKRRLYFETNGEIL